MKLLIGFATGIYVAGAVVTFLMVGFMCLLGGNAGDLWRPFVYSVLWPIVLPWFLLQLKG